MDTRYRGHLKMQIPARPYRTITFIGALLFAGSAMAADPFWSSQRTESEHAITVYRTASCGCCKHWVRHLREHNFQVTERVVDDLSPVRREHGVPPELASCHTAVADGHVFEGHVPAADVKAVLEGDDPARLLSVPGMVSGSPGMDFPGASKRRFSVVAQDDDGSVRVLRSYAGY
jgi:hypothetical protein